jgi:hypothetical protein
MNLGMNFDARDWRGVMEYSLVTASEGSARTSRVDWIARRIAARCFRNSECSARNEIVRFTIACDFSGSYIRASC